MELRVLAIFLTLTGAQQSQLEGPENILSVVGSNVALRCVSPSRNCRQIEWQKYVPDANALNIFKESVGIYGTFRGRYSVDNSSSCHLVIKNVNLTDAGRFTCQTVTSSTQAAKAASLIILKDHPKCATNASENSTAEGDGVQLTCEVTYNATTRPSMVWKRVTNAPDAVDIGGNISRSHSVVAPAPVIPSFTCDTSFPVEAEVLNIATNIPVTTCTTTAITVLYSVRDVTLSPSSSYYTTGTIVTCMAKGNPSPTLKWQEKGNCGDWTDVQSESAIGFTRNDVSANRYRCHATNIVRGISHNATSQEFQFNHTSSHELTSTARTSDSEDGCGLCGAGMGTGIGIGFGIGLLASIVLTTVALAILIRLGFLEFHPKPANKPPDDVAKHSGHKINPSSHQLTAVDQEESAYAGLGEHRDVSEYESLELKQEPKSKTASRV